MSSNNIQCPACGAEVTTKSERDAFEQLTLGPEFKYTTVDYTCSKCGTIGDFSGETDTNLVSAEKIAKDFFVKNTIDELAEKKVSMAFIERVFELPSRTLTRWKTGDFSASALALLRIIKTYPWITETAENRFEAVSANTIIVREAANYLRRVAENTEGVRFDMTLDSNSTQISATAVFSFTNVQTKGDEGVILLSPVQLGA